MLRWGILGPLHGALLLARFARRDDERGELPEVRAKLHEVVLLISLAWVHHFHGYKNSVTGV